MSKRDIREKQLNKEALLINEKSIKFQDQVLNLIPNDYDRNWLFFMIKMDDVFSSPIAYIRENGSLAALGCGYCISGPRRYRDEEAVLFISGKKAIPFSKRSTKLDGISKIADRYLFYCPYCNFLITEYAREKGLITPNFVIPCDNLEKMIQEKK